MKVTRIQLFHVAIPLTQPFYPAWIPGYPQTVNRFTLLRVFTDEGVEGVAAGVAFENERQGLGSLLGPYLLGVDPTDIPTVRQRLREASYLGWRNYWMEAAFWDIKGKAEGRPVWALLGAAEGGRAPVYASTGEVHDPDRRAAEVLELRGRGFRTVKLRVHSFDPADDVAQVDVVRSAVGDTVDLAVDANQGWRVALIDDAPQWDLDRARSFADACADLGVRWIEEPLDMYAYDELAELRSVSRVPIAGGELNGGWHEFKVMMEKGSLDIYQPDATMGGGIGDILRVIEACRQRDLDFSPHTWTNGLGLLVNLHVWAAGPRRLPLEYPLEPPGWVPEVRDGLLTQPIDVDADGSVAIPDGPGLGVHLDEDKLSRFGKKYFDMTQTRLAFKTIRDKGLRTALELGRKRRR
jgi:L-alanine-DL-glutamate epimerase-like enolase superfamily enzyme